MVEEGLDAAGVSAPALEPGRVHGSAGRLVGVQVQLLVVILVLGADLHGDDPVIALRHGHDELDL